MITKLNGKKYNFEIVLKDYVKDSYFHVRAICKKTRRTSCINNLNAVLSEFRIEEVKSKYTDSSWVIPKREAEHFAGIAKRFLSDKYFLKYLETRLDEDRDCGEWENIYQKGNNI